jgi:hypothetical protein
MTCLRLLEIVVMSIDESYAICSSLALWRVMLTIYSNMAISASADLTINYLFSDLCPTAIGHGRPFHILSKLSFSLRNSLKISVIFERKKSIKLLEHERMDMLRQLMIDHFAIVIQ